MHRHLSRLGIYTAIQLIGWSLVVAISLSWRISIQQQEALKLASLVARTHIDKDILYRSWNSKHGGIYVPVTMLTPPNPYLNPAIVPERDIITTTGLQLTLMNPSYMTRQIYDQAQQDHTIAGHMTSLMPIRPENKPDAWELKALNKFELGDPEVSEVVTDSGLRSLRLMKPFITEKSCLRCHAQQGYRLGDIRGGISVMLPLEPFEKTMRHQIVSIWIVHGSLWFVGILGICAGSVSIRRHVNDRNRVAEELQQVNILLKHQATTDHLTGISNRQKGVEIMNYELRRVNRYESPLSLIMFDIDHFKLINDAFGHDTGDATLQMLAALVAANVRSSDLFARWGGEEFLIICPDTTAEDAAILAEKLRDLISSHLFPYKKRVTCSFGIGGFRANDTLESFTKRADKAMYRAKRAGRNRVESG